MNFKQLLKLILGWRAFLIIFAIGGMFLLPFGDKFPYRESLLVPYGSPIFYSWAGFDGVHYLTIAEHGYEAQFTQAFFPVYPLLIRWLTLLTGNYLLSGLLISHVSLLIALYFLYLLVRIDEKKQVAYQTLLLLLAFPTAFFFGALYSESLFLMLVVTSLYAIRKGMTKEAIALALFASATRIIGIFLLPALLYEKYLSLDKKITKNNFTHYLPIFLSAAGLLGYMSYLHRVFGDALYFLNAQSAFGAQRSTQQVILLYQVIFRYMKMFMTVDFTSLLFYTVSLEFITSMLFLALLILAYIKKVRLSYLLFAVPAYLLPTLTGTFSSMPRYVLVLFPGFIVLAKIIPRKWQPVVLTISAILLALNTILFTRGYWVA